MSWRGQAQTAATISTESDKVVILVQVEASQALNNIGRRVNLRRRLGRGLTGGRRAAASRVVSPSARPSRSSRRAKVGGFPHAGTPGGALEGIVRAGSVGCSKGGRSPWGARVRRGRRVRRTHFALSYRAGTTEAELVRKVYTY